MIWCLENFVRGLAIDYEEAFEVAFVSSLDFDMEIELQQFHKELFVLYVWVSTSHPCYAAPARLIGVLD